MNKLNIKRLLQPLGQPLFAIFCALLVGAVAMLITGENPLEIYAIMFKGAFGGKYYFLTTLTRATPIIITGLGAAIAWSSSYMGIGGEGQMILGGFTCALLALYMPGPAPVKLVISIVGALVAGGVYSAISAWLLDKFEMSLAISTLMFNYVAQYVTMHFVANRFLDKSGDAKMTQTYMIDESLRFPQLIPGYSVHLGFIIAVLLVIAVWFLMNRTSFGYESRMTGFNIHFCDYGGVSSKKVMYGILALSGVICAMAGVCEVLGTQYRYVHGTYVNTSYAWIGLNAALISNYNPFGVLITSIILAGISTGGAAIARSTDVPLEISSVIQGCITLFISAKIVIQLAKTKKGGKK
ncbi:MAG: ABC transporter permease [Firmicutes bacterium]|nr:ABC transporter permease [Bacillota bacterium]